MSRADNLPTYTIRQLAAFVAVADTGTISGAAERLHLSQSALAAAVTDLEKALKVQLTVRKRARGVQLTPTGETVLSRARTLLRQAGELQADAAGENGVVAGPLALGCYPSLGPTVLPELFRAFTQCYPDVRIELHEATQNRLRSSLDDGELDLAIAYDLGLSQDWRTSTLGTRDPLVLLAPDHPLAGAPGPLRLVDLAAEPMVLLDAPPSSEHAFEVCRQAGFAPRVAYRTQNFETARAFVGRGLGWTLLVQRPQHDRTYDGSSVVARTDLEPRPDPVEIVVAWNRGSMLSTVSRTFVQFAAGARSTSLESPGNNPG
ncbi:MULTISPECIES: LysR substrate-binding domain-containing protein [Prauserella salsuginis group]|uniref:DNA-binding transcriptional LysR family regulator n=2 Tax=Prauserella salsuginis group TaxID=2893672 RepID=A0A839XQ65_9PSEU|nr:MULTISPECIES: LysR substrate-binding domain-containing protein [Prauserella salsuginis group]MBB3664881.1 DNA-binding transcriptional LysR family regulator [Prauserella sediminis]